MLSLANKISGSFRRLIMETIKEALKTLKGKVIAAVLTLVVAVLGAVQTGIVDFSEVAAAFVGEKAEQVENIDDN